MKIFQIVLILIRTLIDIITNKFSQLFEHWNKNLGKIQNFYFKISETHILENKLKII